MDDKSLTLLLIEDNPDDCELYKRLLRHNSTIGSILEAKNVKEGLEIYNHHTIDCILVDYQLPGENGLSFIENIGKLKKPFVPIIMLTGQGSETVAVEAMKAGAMDYLIKDSLSEALLGRAIHHVLEKTKLLIALEEKTAALERLATTDSLTGLKNRRAFHKQAMKRLSESRRHHDELVLFFIDLDGFKAINDHHGHEIGDRILLLVARTLRATLRSEDIICRLGGDEFIILVSQLEHRQDAKLLAQKILQNLSKPYRIEEKTFQISACIGIAYNDGEKDLDTMLREADKALYTAKGKGNGMFVDFPSMNGNTSFTAQRNNRIQSGSPTSRVKTKKDAGKNGYNKTNE